MYLLFYLTQANAVKIGVFGYDDVVASNGNHTYTYFGSDAVGAEIGAAVNNILTYFNNRQFNLSWYSNPFVTQSPWLNFRLSIRHQIIP